METWKQKSAVAKITTTIKRRRWFEVEVSASFFSCILRSSDFWDFKNFSNLNTSAIQILGINASVISLRQLSPAIVQLFEKNQLLLGVIVSWATNQVKKQQRQLIRELLIYNWKQSQAWSQLLMAPEFLRNTT